MKTTILAALMLGSIAAGATGAAHAGQAGQITHLSGVLSASRADGSSKVLSVKSQVMEGDTLTTEADTYARVKFVDGGEVVLRPGSQLKVENYAFQEGKPESDNMVISLFKGGLRAVTGVLGLRNKDKVRFNTSTATIGIRGTHFGALLCNGDCAGVPTASGGTPPNGLHLDVTTGAIVVRNGAGEIQLNAGQFGFVADSTTAPGNVPAQQGIQVSVPSTIGRSVGASGEAECKL